LPWYCSQDVRPQKNSPGGSDFGLLRPGGTFLNCEHVASRGPWGRRLFDDAMSEHLWRRRTEQGEEVTIEQVRAEYVGRPDRADNILALVEDQCGWLRAIGFQDVDCFWKYFELAIFGGRRADPSAPEGRGGSGS
jgi:hypothetical protein